jgi:hypothetical protein
MKNIVFWDVALVLTDVPPKRRFKPETCAAVIAQIIVIPLVTLYGRVLKSMEHGASIFRVKVYSAGSK